MPGADGMSGKFMKNAFVGWTFTAGCYYPPDFDPEKLVLNKMIKPKGLELLTVRMMMPFTMVCDACGEYNYTGTKFGSKVERIKGEEYLGITIFRFYGKCKHCWSEFTFKTDPQNSDYVMESGGKRTYEAWHDADTAEAELKKQEQIKEDDQMSALEMRAREAQIEMQRIDDLDSIRSINRRLGIGSVQTVENTLEWVFKKKEEEAKEAEKMPAAEGEEESLKEFRQEKEELKRKRVDEEVESEIAKPEGFGASSSSSSSGGPSAASSSSSSGAKTAQPEAGAKTAQQEAVERMQKQVADDIAKKDAAKKSAVGARFSVKKRAVEDPATSKPTAAESAPSAAACAPSGLAGLGSYDSDSSSS